MKKLIKLLGILGISTALLFSSIPVAARGEISSRMGTVETETNPDFAQPEEIATPPDLILDDTPLEDLLMQGFTGTDCIPQDEISLKDYITSNAENLLFQDEIIAAATNGWVSSNGKWQYYVNGVAVTGWRQIDSVWYYFDTDTYMVTGWKKISGKWYYFNSSGAMVTGTVQIGSETYYFESSGAMYQGLYPSASAPTCYYGHPDQPDAGAKYKAGWLHVGDEWYYANKTTGTLFSGESELDYKRFYFQPTSRVMRHGYVTVNGESRYYDDDSTSSNYGVLWEGVYDIVTALSSDDLEHAMYNVDLIGEMGYIAKSVTLPLPTDTFNDLPTRKISIVHGHGSPGYIRFDNEEGGSDGYLYGHTATLYNSDARISDYTTDGLDFVDLAIYTSCYSACSNNNSVAQWTYAKGAQAVLGYHHEVTRGEYFSAYLLAYLKLGQTLEVATQNAIQLFDSTFSDLLTNDTRASSPSNLRFYGNTDQIYPLAEEEVIA